VNDPSLCAPTPLFAFGTVFDRTTEFFNCAGWPNDPNYGGTDFWPAQLRIWTR